MSVAEDRHTEDQAEHTGTTCPVCGARAERGQLICLECGSRIALRHRRPPSWKVPVGIVLGVIVLAIAGGVLAYEALDADAQREAASAPPRVADADADRGGGSSSDSDRSGSGAPEDDEGGDGDEPSLGGTGQTNARSPGDDGDSLLPDGSAADSADPSATDQAEDPGTAAPAGELVPDGELFTWPRSLRGFTVVVQSNEDRASATAFARSVAQSSDGQVGVIGFKDFRTIPEGFFVVFVGRYEGRAAAERAAVRLGRTYPGAFPQAVRR